MGHSTNLAVRFYELDPYGHVNHATYLNYFEVARVEMLDDLGYGLAVLAKRDVQLVVVEAHVRYKAPAVAGDVLTIETEAVELRRASSRWHQRMTREGQLVATNDLRAAICDASGRPIRPPEDVVAALSTLLAT